MKGKLKMSKAKLLVVLVFCLFCANFVLAQYNDASVSGPQIDTKNVIREEIKPDNVSLIKEQPVRQQTDEYGSYNFNAYLAALGSTGGYVAVPNAFNENVDGSLEAWIYPTATTSSSPAIVAKGDATNVGLFWYWNASTLLMGIRFGNTPTTNTGGTTVPLNQWSHVAVTWSGGAGNYTVTFYVNGVQSGSTVNNTGSWNVTSDSLTIGSSRASFGGKNFYGYIDEVRYWDDVRTLAEIRNNRFVGIGDGGAANAGNALTSSTSYAGCNSSWTFNAGGVYDDIGGYNGFHRNGAGNYYAEFASQPMPYNLALYCPFDAGSYVQVPGNTVFSGQSGAGSIDAWVNPTAQSTTHMVVSRGTAGFDFFWGIRASISNKQVLCINNTQLQNSDGVAIPLNKWTHVAVKWVLSGGNATATFYVNGQQSGTPVTSAATWSSTLGTVRIGGWHGGTANNFSGYLDEVRFWGVGLTLDQLRRNMFVSCRNIAGTPVPLAAYNFDGNLNNFTSTTGINGSFSTGGTNNCRLSGFVNETSSGALSNSFVAHPTVINKGGSPNPFPLGFNMRYVNKNILDNTTIYDTLRFAASRTITSVEVFVAIQHSYVGDLTLVLRAPNNATRNITVNLGGTGDNILSFFVDGATPLSTSGFYPPWSVNASPEAAFGNFGGANMQGRWILSVNDNLTGFTGVLMAWGIRFNGDNVSGVEPVSGNIPDKFELFQNYPNPFNSMTNVKWQMSKAGITKLIVYDLLGREVTTLVDEYLQPGTYEIRYDAGKLSSGIYFYKLETEYFTDIKRMILVK